MLWVDDNFVTQADIEALDVEAAELADTAKISIPTVIERAKDDCRNYLSRFMSFSNANPKDLSFRDVNIPVNTPGLKWTYAGFAQLVVTGDNETLWSPLKSWVANKTLLKLYKAAVNKAGDRYSDRFDRQEEEIKCEHWPNLRKYGLPLVWGPLPAPGAIEEMAGTFAVGNVDLTNGSGTLANEVDYAITWVGDVYVSGTDKHNGESFTSQRIRLTMLNGSVAVVNKLGLTPPNGQQPLVTKASSRYSPGKAVGWNVWAGLPDAPLYRQNVSVLPLTQNTFTFTGNPVFSGERMDTGQVQELVLEIPTQLVRA
jgi:hypothetical protein